MRFSEKKAFWESTKDRRGRVESSFPATVPTQFFKFALAVTGIMGVLGLVVSGEARTLLCGVSLSLGCLGLGYFLWLAISQVTPSVRAIFPLSYHDARYLETVDWNRSVRAVKWMYAAALVSLVPIAIATVNMASRPDAFEYLAARGVFLIILPVLVILALVSIFAHIVPRVKDVRAGALDLKHYHTVTATSAVGVFWMLLALLLAFLPAKLTVGILVRWAERSAFHDAVMLADTMLAAIMLCLLWTIVVLITAFYLLPWVLVSGRKALLHIAVFTVAGIVSFLAQRNFALWCVLTLVYVLVVDTVVGAKGARLGRKLWILVSGITVSVVGLGLAVLFAYIGLNRYTIPVVALGLSLDFLLNVGTRRVEE
ncbi:MAG: hypothetical protein JXA57_00755 [Armatimonadetes bacterium]|nr:hypothetical protein [Armatimonadota bacterium]